MGLVDPFFYKEGVQPPRNTKVSLARDLITRGSRRITTMVEARRQEKESTQGLIRRFTKKIQQSGILLRARESRFRQREKSRQMKKRAALRREEIKKEYKKLRKLGKL